MSDTMTIRLAGELKSRLDRLSKSTQRSKSFLAAEAVRQYLEANEWQIAEIRAAIKEAAKGEFATDDDVADLARKGGVGAD